MSFGRPAAVGQPLEVLRGRGRADVDVDGRMAGVVQAGGDTTDDDDVDLVLEEHPTDGSRLATAGTDERVGSAPSPSVPPAIGATVTDENLTAQHRIPAAPSTVFALLADPANHAAIDGTGWVRGPLQEGARITAEGEVFDMAMYHPQHPDGDYEIANRVVAFEPTTAIEWEPGFYLEDGQRDSGRWTWRYDLEEVDGQTEVTLTYDWSNATPEARERFQFPPFGVEKLAESLDNLATLASP